MDILILINQVIFSILLSLLLLELGSALLSLADYEKYKERLTSYIAPTWEITGTFSVFYLVNFEATFPSLLPAIGTMYILPVLVAVTFVIVRDAFLAYTEYIGTEKDEKRFARVYGISTIAMMIIITTILSSTISGIGVNLSSLSLNPLIVLNPYNLLMILSLLAFVAFAAIVFFNIEKRSLLFISIIVAFALILFASAAFTPFMLQSLATNPLVVLPSMLLLVAIIVLYWLRKTYAKFLVLPWLFCSVLAFQLIEYPSLFSNSIQISSYITSQASAPYVLIITLAGGAFLAVALSLFVYVHHVHKEEKFHEHEY